MNTSTALDNLCTYCGKPVVLEFVQGKSGIYHPECVHGPGWAQSECLWTHDEDTCSWDSNCGEKWHFLEGNPVHNRVKFCYGCGKRIKLAEQPKDV